MTRRARSYADHLDKALLDPTSTIEYLRSALDEDVDTFLLALRDVAKARGGGFAKLAEDAGLNRENLYRMLAPTGNPTMRSLESILRCLGYRLSVDAIEEAGGPLFVAAESQCRPPKEPR
jgi:probable addiction module antidote protein